MRTPNGLYFAPNIRFKDLNLDDANVLANALEARAEEWFLRPSEEVATDSPFAAGVIVVCFIDAAAEFNGMGVAQWLADALPSSARRDPRRDKKTIAEAFAEDVRNGLVHHARLNRGTEFSLDLEEPIAVVHSVLVVNPRELITVVRSKWQDFINRVRSDPGTHRSVAREIGRVFRADFDADASWTSSSQQDG